MTQMTPKELQEKKARFRAIMEKAKTENRSFVKEETDEMNALKAEIEAAEADLSAAAASAAQNRSAAAARITVPVGAKKKNLNAHLRSITKASSEVGDVEVVDDVVRVYVAQSPIFRAHQGKQLRLTGTAFTYPKVTAGTGGYKKTEGNDATSDSGSTITMVTLAFSTYSSQQITVSQEMLDDAGFDVGAEVEAIGMSKSTAAFDADAVTALETYDATPTETAGTNVWAMSDLVAAYFELPDRNRQGVKFITAPATAASIIALLTNTNAPQAAVIGLTAENIIIDDNVTAGLVLVCNPTLALAIGMKQQVRIFMQEQSKGRVYEVQPRMAVGLRDVTAVTGRKLKTS
jgi:HK97 family phage major capsid protein